MNHQKNAKFCIDIQNKLNLSEVIRCQFCLKDFSTKKYLDQHTERCKDKKISDQKELELQIQKLTKQNLELKQQLSKKQLDFKHQIKEENSKLKLKLNFKDETIEKMQKEIQDYKKLLSRPTTVVNNANTTNNNNNYQVQYNQLIQNTEPLVNSLLSDKIKNLTSQNMDQYDLKHIEETVSDKLSDIFKDFTFCTDRSRKTVVIKKEDQTTEKMSVENFTNMCLQLGISDIQKFITELNNYYTNKLGSYEVSDEDFIIFDNKCEEISGFINTNDNIDIQSVNNPLKYIPNKVMNKCRQLNKGT